jgi:hypothetical protein
LLISGFAGLLPVDSWVLMDKWLIINGIRFSGGYAFAGSFVVRWYPLGGYVGIVDDADCCCFEK